jgi:hypothetical protein
MGHYRLLFIDCDVDAGDGVDFDCSTDGEAINMSLDRADGRALELWSGERKILWSAPTTPRARRTTPAPSLLSARPRNYSNW